MVMNHFHSSPSTIFDDLSDSYTVKGGDTLASIATFHKTSIEAIKKANGLHSDKLFVGQVMSIPINIPFHYQNRENTSGR
jgi:LysM repeat protein